MEGWCPRKQPNAWGLGDCVVCLERARVAIEGRPCCQVGVDRLERSTTELEGMMEGIGWCHAGLACQGALGYGHAGVRFE